MIVRKKNGWSPMKVAKVYGQNPTSTVCVGYCGKWYSEDAHYLDSMLKAVTDPEKEFARCKDWQARLTDEDYTQLKLQMGEITMTKLYQTKEATPRFGLLLATNSAGKLVLEMKGAGEVLAFDKNTVEEVKPYTVAVKFVGSGGSSTSYDFISREGDVDVGDLLFINGYPDMARVTDVNTKSNRATKELVGRKIVTAPFGA
jgi:hypothetical protein